MRDPKRIARITGKLMQAWLMAPDMRLGQLIINLSRLDMVPDGWRLWNVEDDRWEQMLDHFLETGSFS